MKRLLTVVLALCMIFALCACGQSAAPAAPAAPAESGFTPAEDSVLNTGVFRVAMECAYAPYNWTQSDDSNGAVPIYGAKDFANGYDVMMAQKIADANGWTLEIHKMDWDSIPLAVQSG
ncbi:MAG: ABC transporter substrate-binding protein, partial [Oscillospiraceae bacterium]|nr:ABC transporter substrate-binding protein [Oscillospiraceae bacterium]